MKRSASILIVGHLLAVMLLALCAWPAMADDPWVVYEGGSGPGQGKHIVLVSGDEEYRSEEMLPQLAKILSKHHGFKCTVLFAIDPSTGEIDPMNQKNIPGLEALKTADLMIIFTRFRDLPDGQMQHIVDYLDAGKPVIGIRTATHAFSIRDANSKFAKYTHNGKAKDYEQGFGKQVLGETWVAHHGLHGKESTRGLVPAEVASHPILRGIKDGEIWGPTDVYRVKLPLPDGCQTLVLGQNLDGMTPDAAPVATRSDKAKSTPNEPLMPIAWTKTYTPAGSSKTARVFTTTMGSSQDLSNEAFRRLLVNASYWCLGTDDKIAPKSTVDVVGKFAPTPFKSNGHQKGVKPADLR